MIVFTLKCDEGHEFETWFRDGAAYERQARRGLVTCPDCGSTVLYSNEGWPGVLAVPLGAFADPDFPAPSFSVYEHRKHRWVEIVGDAVEHSASPSIARAPGHRI